MEISLRKFLPGDAEFLSVHGDNPAVFKNMSDAFPNPFTLERAHAFIEMANTPGGSLRRAIECDGQLVGAIGVHPGSDIYRLNAEMGYWLAEPWWGKGIMTEAVKQMVKFAFSQLEIERIYATPFDTNPASLRVLEKAGFTFEYRVPKNLIKLGELKDQIIYSIRRSNLQ